MPGSWRIVEAARILSRSRYIGICPSTFKDGRRARVMPMYFCQRHALIRGCLQRRPGIVRPRATSMEAPKERRKNREVPSDRIMNGKPAICYRNSVRLMGGSRGGSARTREFLMGYLISRDGRRKSKEEDVAPQILLSVWRELLSENPPRIFLNVNNRVGQVERKEMVVTIITSIFAPNRIFTIVPQRYP